MTSSNPGTIRERALAAMVPDRWYTSAMLGELIDIVPNQITPEMHMLEARGVVEEACLDNPGGGYFHYEWRLR